MSEKIKELLLGLGVSIGFCVFLFILGSLRGYIFDWIEFDEPEKWEEISWVISAIPFVILLIFVIKLDE